MYFLRRLAHALVGCAWVVVLGCHGPDQPRAQPNIVLVIADDHGWPDYGFTGSDLARTPHLDALARSGTSFRNAYSTASVCRPALRSILTGLHPHQFERRSRQLARRRLRSTGTRGHVLQGLPNLPAALAKAGYVTFQAGKLWDGTYSQAGFSHGTTASPDLAATHFRGNRDARELGRETLAPVFSFVRENRAAPFFLWFAPQLPHVPFDAPAEFRAPYEGRGLAPDTLGYYANCAWEDAVVGRLLAFLDEEGLREDTVVVYLSDNGWDATPDERWSALGGDHGKASMYELGFHTPLIFRWPGRVPAGRTVDDFVSIVDVFPTLLALAGADPVAGLPGVDLTPTVLGGSQPARAYLVGGQFSVRDRRAPEPFRSYAGDAYYLTGPDWYYILWGGLNRQMLFDKRADPEERHDVADLHPERAAEFRERVLAWLDEIGVGRRSFGWSPGDARRPAHPGDRPKPRARPARSPPS